MEEEGYVYDMPLHMAAIHTHWAVCRALMEVDPEVANIPSLKNATPLSYVLYHIATKLDLACDEWNVQADHEDAQKLMLIMEYPGNEEVLGKYKEVVSMFLEFGGDLRKAFEAGFLAMVMRRGLLLHFLRTGFPEEMKGVEG